MTWGSAEKVVKEAEEEGAGVEGGEAGRGDGLGSSYRSSPARARSPV